MKITLNINSDKKISEVNPYIYGGFVEHLGRNVYGGVYSPEDPTADEDGFRKDVLELVHDLDVPITRYPGGCFSSSWMWEDGVGKDRPVRLDSYWKQLEPNSFGLSEFMKWTKKAKTEPLLTFNVSMRTALDAARMVEYCNFPKGTTLSDQRRANGDEEPYGIQIYCLGNEQYGIWEYGHAPAEDYGVRAREVVKQVRNLQPDAKFILCGDADSMEWNEKALDVCYDYVDMLSIHFGLWTGEKNDDTYIDRLKTCREYIEDSIKVCEKIRKKHNSEKRLTLAVDEWILWDGTKAPVPGEEWTCGMHLLEQDYFLRDVLLVGGLYSLFHNTADKVSLVCEAQTVNVIAPIRTAPNGVIWKQGIYYPIRYASRYGRGTALKVEGAPERIYTSAVHNTEKNEVALYLTNSSFEEIDTECFLNNFGAEWEIAEAVMLTSSDETACNTADKTVLAPEALTSASVKGDLLTAKLASRSWNFVLLRKK